MHFFHKVRMLNRWSRAVLVGFALVFGLNSIAHAAHQHEPTSATISLHSTVCGFCVSFDHLATTPTPAAIHLSAEVESFAVLVSDAAPPALRVRSTAQPRAPPVS